MNGFKIAKKNEGDESDNTYLIKSLPYSKKTQFTIDGNLTNNYSFRFPWIALHSSQEPRLWVNERRSQERYDA